MMTNLIGSEASCRVPQTRKPLTEAEFQQHLLNIGLMSSLPDPALAHVWGSST
jgi:hypothetical protein